MLLLIIRDGWGVNDHHENNAVKLAGVPGYEALLKNYPQTLLEPGGKAVGLPEGQMGNSEVGHMNIGSGRVVWQDLEKITNDLQSGEFFQRNAFQSFLKKAEEGNGRVHLLGLLSDGGVHSHQNHLHGILEGLRDSRLNSIHVHAFMDGRDTSPTGGRKYLKDLQEVLEKHPLAQLGSISGRFYSMDRDQRWERIEKGYNILVRGDNLVQQSPEDYLQEKYQNDVTDEFMTPALFHSNSTIQNGDSVFFFNFRPDRAREMTQALLSADFEGFETETLHLNYLCMTPYGGGIEAPVLYTKDFLKNTLSETISKAGLKQFKIAETEKYAHVTYFLNGGREEPFEGEERCLIPSPTVKTYDMKPEMSAYEVTEKLLEAMQSGQYSFLCVNYANPDMVGHTGDMEASKKAVRVVDECVSRLTDKAEEIGAHALITADHGNLDEMFDFKSGDVLTNHSLNPVDLILFAPKDSVWRQTTFLKEGKLADIAPTILQIMELDSPPEMDGDCLLKSKS